MNLIDLLSILLRCNGFTRIQKAIVGQTGSRPPNSDHDLFGCKFGFGKSLEHLLSPVIELVIPNMSNLIFLFLSLFNTHTHKLSVPLSGKARRLFLQCLHSFKTLLSCAYYALGSGE